MDLNEEKKEIVELISENKKITILELSKIINISDRAVKKQIAKLKKENKLKRIGPDKGGHWELIK